ncbi:tannase/feruloyl esterase family alpha/beta hydrolase [Rhizobium sp.]|uniref:tannase/feruloyl esterase family alpha/beta hydrolase n=1 Tax=Rhizobium sp. TaxID=391 RepID=UPI002AA7DE27
MKQFVTGAIGALIGAAAISGGTTPALAAEKMTCEALAGATFNIAGLTIQSSKISAAGDAIGKSDKSPVNHCVVLGKIGAHKGVDGQDYAISFELRLPDGWNGDFVHQFNGGNDGFVVPALGQVMGGDRSKTALGMGFAVVSSDSGHDALAVKDAGLAGGARFGFDPQARRDYGYTAIETLNPAALKIVETYYGKPVRFKYGMGGSNGGRHALVEAARSPGAFNGLLVGYPGYHLPKAAIQHAWDVQAMKPVTGDIRTAFPPAAMTVLQKGILASCDALDGLVDGVVADSVACQKAFDVTKLECKAGSSDGCLSAAQIKALTTMEKSPRDSAGKSLYSAWIWDTGMAATNWSRWRLEGPKGADGTVAMPFIVTLGAPSLAQIFMTPPVKIGGTPEELENFLLNFNFDTDAPKIFAKTAEFPESSYDFMVPPGADNPDLAAFRDAGGKMIVFHGNGDPVFSVVDTIDWYQKLDANNGGKARNFARFYQVPGMPHGAGGPSTDDFDMFTALVNWVEKGKAPEAIVAGVTADNKEGQDALGDIKRKLCPYPQVARYVGSDPKSADSFVCQ